MSSHISPFAELSGTQVVRWVALLPKLALGALLVGGIIAAILWITASGSVGQDLSVLTLCISFALMVTFMSVREVKSL